MTYAPMADLKEFHDRFDPDGVKRNETPPLALPLLKKRAKLIKEEFNEVMEAMDYLISTAHRTFMYEFEPERFPTGMEELAKELADLLYVVYGTAEELGIPLEGVFNEVHRNNMDKLWPDGKVHYNEYGKVIKPPTYEKPDLSFIHDNRV